MTRFQYGINYDLSWCISGWLGTVFDVNLYEITPRLDKLIEFCFSDIWFEVCSEGKLEGLVAVFQDGINYRIFDVLLVGWAHVLIEMQME